MFIICRFSCNSLYLDSILFYNWQADVITAYGYPVEVHKIKTDDDYILSLFRIPCGKNESECYNEKNNTTAKPAIFLMHGFLSSSYDYISEGPNVSLPFLLADKGYDIWLGNSRGSIASREHVRWTDNDKEYWNFR